MKGYVQDIESIAVKNEEFRRVLYTARNCQLVVMALKPREDIGMEVHKLDQFFRVEEGTGEAVLDGVRTAIRAGFAVLVPAGTNHNIINAGSVPMKLYTLYAPPNHRDGVVHHTRAEAEKDNEHFDGKTTNRDLAQRCERGQRCTCWQAPLRLLAQDCQSISGSFRMVTGDGQG